MGDLHCFCVSVKYREECVPLLLSTHTPREGRAAQTHFLCYVKRVEGPGVGSHSGTSLLTKAFIVYTQRQAWKSSHL